MADFVLAPLPPSEPHACLPLGPPLWTAEVESNEGRPASDATSQNPTFELVYWRFGLTLAARWRRRLGLPPVPAWQEVLARLCKPTARPLRGVPGAPPGYRPYERSSDAALISNGVAPQLFAAAFAPGETLGADAAALRNTLGATIAALLRNLPWGSDAAMYAMAAARLGNASLAASILADPDGVWTRRFAPSGHYANAFLPVYLSANGALLAAVAFMAGGWDGDGGRPAPGFPRDGSWTVRAEGFSKYF